MIKVRKGKSYILIGNEIRINEKRFKFASKEDAEKTFKKII